MPPGYLHLLPSGYHESDACFPVVYMLHGLGGSADDWLAHTRIARHAAPYPFLLIFPDADSSWYTDSADGASRWGHRFLDEMMPDVEARFRTVARREGRGLIGLSMGGFGACRLALAHPDRFAAAASHSGSLLKAREETPPDAPHPVFGDPRRDAAHRRANDPFVLAERLAGSPGLPALYLDCGLKDYLLEASRAFHARLERLSVPHAYAERPGYHTWPYWNRAVRHSLEWMAARLVGSQPCPPATAPR